MKKYEHTIIASDFRSPLVRNEIWTGFPPYWKNWHKLPLVHVGIHAKKNAIQYFVNMDEWKAAQALFTTQVETHPEILLTIIKKARTLGQKMNTYTQQVMTGQIELWSNSQMMAFYNKYVLLQTKTYAAGVLLPLLDIGEESFLESFLQNLLEERLPVEKQQSAYTVFTQPQKRTFAGEQKDALETLSVELFCDNTLRDMFIQNTPENIFTLLKEQHPNQLQKIQVHTKKYCWVYYVYSGPAFTEIDFIRFLKDLAPKFPKVSKNNFSDKEDLMNREELLKALQPTPKEKILLDCIPEIVVAKPQRKEFQSKSYYHMESFYREFAKRMDISLKLARAATKQQILSSLESGSISVGELKEQVNEHVCFYDDGVRTISGTEAELFYNTRTHPDTPGTDKESTTLRGRTAQPGDVTGIVKIINEPSMIEKMEEGDVLVSIATTPSIISAMKKASAIITDEGGLTCHAAIVSRELQIPCVVGTKHATQILQDGDRVHVDAENGVVEIL